MAYLNKTSQVLKAVLTNKGREKLAQGDFNVTHFALADDEIDYSLWDMTPSGSNFVKPYGQVIDNQPVLEPTITDNEIMRYFLFKDGIDFTTTSELPDVTPPFSSFFMSEF